MRSDQETDLEVKGRFIITTGYGAWNMECALMFGDDMRRIIESFDSQPWGGILDIRKWELSPPECWTEFNEQREFWITKNYQVEAIVYNSKVQEGVAKKKRYRPGELNTFEFDDYDEAFSFCTKEAKKLSIPIGQFGFDVQSLIVFRQA